MPAIQCQEKGSMLGCGRSYPPLSAAVCGPVFRGFVEPVPHTFPPRDWATSSDPFLPPAAIFDLHRRTAGGAYIRKSTFPTSFCKGWFWLSSTKTLREDFSLQFHGQYVLFFLLVPGWPVKDGRPLYSWVLLKISVHWGVFFHHCEAFSYLMCLLIGGSDLVFALCYPSFTP